ncbi:unannotated protein [freshwater metagenome]|uniref:Unannotated protein n=1 Tax=freshwater metagenome TaxID=449393 RepID=A0A6J6NQ22_9ZZZZ
MHSLKCGVTGFTEFGTNPTKNRNRDDQPESDNAKGNGERLPRRQPGNKNLRNGEGHLGVDQQQAHVHD